MPDPGRIEQQVICWVIYARVPQSRLLAPPYPCRTLHCHSDPPPFCAFHGGVARLNWNVWNFNEGNRDGDLIFTFRTPVLSVTRNPRITST